jgi:hypothetical protein
MLDTRNNYSKITQWITTLALSVLTGLVCLSETYNTQSIIGLCVALWLLCIIGLLYKTKTIQQLRPIILLAYLVWFGFVADGCNCILFYFQGFLLFLMGNSAFWISFTVIILILILSIIFGPLWCGWLCWLGALQEFIYKKKLVFFTINN